MINKLLPLFCILIMIGCTVQRIPTNEREEIKVYFSSTDLVNTNPDSGIWFTKIKKSEDDYVQCHKIFNGENNIRLQEPNLPWAINVRGEDYLHMRYCDEYRNEDVYVKYDIQGKVCALFISGDTSGKIKSGGKQAYHYGGGLFGVIMKDEDKWGKNWKNAKTEKFKILIINTTRINPRTEKPYKKHLSKLLSKKNFNEQLNTNYTKKEIENFSFEKIVEIIEEINASD